MIPSRSQMLCRCMYIERIIFGRASTPIGHFFCNISPFTGFIRHDDDGQNVAFIEAIPFGVLDRPNTIYAAINSACLMAFLTAVWIQH